MKYPATPESRIKSRVKSTLHRYTVKLSSTFDSIEEAMSGEADLIVDALSGAKLASVGFGSEKSKSRRLQLHNPDEDVSFEYTSKL